MFPNPVYNQLLEHAVAQYGPRKNILDQNFPFQSAFIEDPAHLKALWCTRRAAKSFTAGIYLHHVADTFPSCNCLYIGLTRSSAKGIIWKDILSVIDQKHSLGVHPNNSELTMTHSNGSIIHLTGVDADASEMHKLLGKKWKLVIIDEAQSYSVDLRTLIYGVLGPACVDEGGTICLMGTSGNLTQGLFYDVTQGKEPGWKLFEWTAYDNPYVAKQWAAEIENIKNTRPQFMETALYKQWFLNKWVIDDQAKVYKFNRDRNICQGIPRDEKEWHYVLGLDLAHSPDSTAFVIGAYQEYEPTLYLVYSYKATRMDITDVALHIRNLERVYEFDVKVTDGANKQAVAELNNRHSMGLIAADKKDKADFITIMNDDFIQGRIKLVESATKELQEEYQRLVWVTDANGKVLFPKKENPVIHNDLADGSLYLWRHCYTYLKVFQDKEPWVNPHVQSEWEKAHIHKLSEQIKKEQNPFHDKHLELTWNEEWDKEDILTGG